MTRPLLCETVTGRTLAELIAARDASSADLVELRVDGVSDLDVAGALAGRRKPVVFTCRAAWEGGRFDGAEEQRRSLLGAALDAGAEFVDVEWKAHFDALVARDPARIVLSSHDFNGVPADLADRVTAMRATGAGTIKVAVMTRRLVDLLPLLHLPREGQSVLIGMGEHGVASRLLAARFGSRWTYAGDGVAPGQIPVARMLEEFRIRETHAGTRLFAVVSQHAMHSMSPAMHNAAFAATGIDGVYVPLSAVDFVDFAAFALAIGLEGASVTIPFKLDALAAATHVDEQTAAVGAANTLRRSRSGSGRGWDATNTDVDGFLAPLDAVWTGTLRGARAAVLGAGGAARAVVAGLVSRGVEVSVHARRQDEAEKLAEALGGSAGAWPPARGSWDLLVNTTPLGGTVHRDVSPLPEGPFDGALVYDLTYGPGQSRLLRDAAAAGCRVLDGLAMLAAQAERQFEWWTGVRPPDGVMLAAAGRRAMAAAAPAVAPAALPGSGDRR